MSSGRPALGGMELEMEEVEGLVSDGSSSNGHHHSPHGRHTNGNLVKIKFSGIGSKPSVRRSSNTGESLLVRCVHGVGGGGGGGGGRRGSAFLFLVAGLIILILVYNGEGEVQELEGAGHPSMADVEDKMEGGHPVAVDLPPPPEEKQKLVHDQNHEVSKGGAVTVNVLQPPKEEVPEPDKEEKEGEKEVDAPVPALETKPAPEPKENEEDKEDESAPSTEPAKDEGKLGDEKKENEKKDNDETKDEKDDKKNVDAPVSLPEPKPAPAPDEPWRAPEIDPDRKSQLVARWGEWHFWDGDSDSRPPEDYCAKFPHRDIPETDFPASCWQVDPVYVNHFLDAASNLIQRAQEAIYTEYGHGKPSDGTPMTGQDMINRAKMFKVHEVDLGTAAMPPDGYEESGGWTTERSMKGLVRRLLHAMMTNDSFTVVMGGTNTAAGGGNHFAQSYPMQFHSVMEPVFARLGVKLVTRNMGQEGLGTLHGTLGSGSIWGDEVDMVVWDSEETEEERSTLDLIARQALLGGKRVPVLWGGDFEVLKELHEKAGVDVGQHGWGWSGVPATKDDDQAKGLPWAAQYLKCEKGKEVLCDKPEIKFKTKCWVEREDVKPTAEQEAHLDGQDEKHPGYRWHRLLSRVLAFTVLDALQDAVSTWSDITITGGHPLPDEHWHIADYYKEVREKLLGLDDSVGFCSEMKKFVPERLCKVPVQARTEFTPRADPDNTSISSIIKPAKDGYVPRVQEEMLYVGTNVENPVLSVPAHALNVPEIVSLGMDQDKKAGGRRRMLEPPSPAKHHSQASEIASGWVDMAASLALGWARALGDDAIIPGTGWEVVGELPGRCDGTASGVCGRLKSSKCLLSGHVDSRGGVLGNEYSGWLVMVIKDVQEGVIVLKLETEHSAEESKRTEGWTAVNNGKRRLGAGVVENAGRYVQPRSPTATRQLLPDGFEFDYAIDGTIQTLNKAGLEEKIAKPQDGVELLTVLDDRAVKKDVELAIRMRGCGRDCTIALTHVYWA